MRRTSQCAPMPLSTSRPLFGHRNRSVFVGLSIGVTLPPRWSGDRGQRRVECIDQVILSRPSWRKAEDENTFAIGGAFKHFGMARSANSVVIGATRSSNAQLVDARFRRITGNRRSIDGADRNARGPVRMNINVGQCLVDPGLIRTERTSPWRRSATQSNGGRCFISEVISLDAGEGRRTSGARRPSRVGNP
jgi:hypothetical protein